MVEELDIDTRIKGMQSDGTLDKMISHMFCNYVHPKLLRVITNFINDI